MSPAEKGRAVHTDRTVKAVGKAKPTAKVSRAPRKKATRAAAPQVRVVLQYMGREISQAEMAEAASAAWQAAGGQPAALQSIDLYIKPEDNAVYYVVNGETTGKLPI